MDTCTSSTRENINPQLAENYNGEDLTLLNGTVLSVEKFPHFEEFKRKNFNYNRW